MLETLKADWRRFVAVLLGALVLIWPAVINGQPFFHPDTQAYIRGPDVAIMSLTGFHTPWATHDPGVRAAAPATETVPAPQASYQDDEVIAGRSIYYGLLPYLGQLTGGFWLTVLVQALAIALLAEILLRNLGRPSLKAYAGAVALLAFATSAPFFASLLMPDVWAGVAIAAFAALLVFRRLALWERLTLGALLVYAVMSHNSHVLVVAALTALAGLLWALRRPRGPVPKWALGAGVLAVALGLLGSAVFGLMVAHKYGKGPITPPFLTARVIADGPGRRFIETRCPSAGFEVCRYAARLPADVDEFLWAGAPTGVFETATPQSRRALAQEQTRFAAAVFFAYPLEQTQASLGNALRQLVNVELEDFRYKPSVRATRAQQLPEPHRTRMLATRAAADAWPLAFLQGWQGFVAIAAFLLMPRNRRGEPLTDDQRHAAAFAWIVVAGVLINAGVCGAFSALHGRYEARVMWLLPLAVYAQALLLAEPGRWLGWLRRGLAGRG